MSAQKEVQYNQQKYLLLAQELQVFKLLQQQKEWGRKLRHLMSDLL